ncbi:hypothetical protein C8R46DRAFT_309518 [Mycena filopes]|nr:hypothetical protein C8R46DRAFT_309518 [Mycena filopes]
MDQVLPPELEQEIFELCALYYPRSVPRFVLVARRFNEWVGPLLCRTLVFDDPSYSIKHLPTDILPVYSTHRMTPLGQNASLPALATARHLFLSSLSDSAASTELLAASINVENLSLMGASAEWIPLISRLPLRQLYAPPPEIIPTLGPAFPHLTHLEIFEGPRARSLSACDALAELPQLSHLAFHARLPKLFLRLLRICAELRVLVCLPPLGVTGEGAAELTQDVRFVCMGCRNYVQDWYMGARWGEDYWQRAELFIAKRRAGEINHFDAEDESLAMLPLAA